MSKAGKGHARAAGRSVQDVLLKDTVPAPLPLLASAYDFLGDDDLDAQRYTEAGFAAKEMTKMWAKTWQWACREEHIPEPGDRYVYDIGPYSVIISRDEAGIVHAFRNSCTHRGTPPHRQRRHRLRHRHHLPVPRLVLALRRRPRASPR